MCFTVFLLNLSDTILYVFRLFPSNYWDKFVKRKVRSSDLNFDCVQKIIDSILNMLMHVCNCVHISHSDSALRN